MQQDDIVWESIHLGKCSFQRKTTGCKPLCANEYNLTGLCNRASCPLANSQYATVREDQGKIYLYMKLVERSVYPNRQWERVKLSSNSKKAMEQIDMHLIFWSAYNRQKCKKRAAKLNTVLKKCRRLHLDGAQETISVVKKKGERRDRARERKALIAAKIERAVEDELVDRLQKGVYGDLYKIKNVETVENNAAEQMELSDSEIEYVEDMEESDFDIEDSYQSVEPQKLKHKIRYKK